ncbi:hypothetical protein LTR04_005052 [Oleoguttula sp. CCFEE 6159]|nr:hypothetical protein LTR04_005052 [Oleoguttula sp. CCFEE 6159]
MSLRSHPSATSIASSEEAALRPKPLNFSRPRPRTADSQDQDDCSWGYPTPQREAPPAPETRHRSSYESSNSGSANTYRSSNSSGWGSRFQWDGQYRGDSDASPSHPKPTRYESSGNTSIQEGSQESRAPLIPPMPPIPQKFGPIPPRMPRIVKRTSVDQMSIHLDPRNSSSSVESDWQASTYDTSGLSVEEIHKCKKKGINPALYAEMRAARKGKGKWMSPLVGNTFIG